MEQVTCHHFQGAKPSSLKCRNPLSNFTSDDPFLIFNLSHVPLHSVASTNYTAPPSLAIHIEYTQASSKETCRPNGFTELSDKWTHYLVRANLPVLYTDILLINLFNDTVGLKNFFGSSLTPAPSLL